MSRTRRPLAALAMVAVTITGCSNGSTDQSTGSTSAATTSAATTSAATTNITTPRDKAVKFAECMRDSGLSAFPDPTASGDFAIGFDGSSLDPSSAAWKKAIAACKDLEPPGALGEGNRTSAEMTAALNFARCMRDSGVKDFPDPVEHGPLIDTNKIPSLAGKDPRSGPFADAIQK
jgi:hypothetical protein